MKPPIPTPEENLIHLMVELIQRVSEQMLTKKVKESPFYDSADLKMHLHVCDKTLQRWRKSGKIPYRQVGKKYYYPKSFFDF